jgi:uncharacterized paraquat-inducible protein A
MGEWHRDNPELTGTDADPWMSNPGYAAAAREVRMYQQFPNLDAMIAEAEERQLQEAYVCLDCSEYQPEQPSNACRECGGKLRECNTG